MKFGSIIVVFITHLVRCYDYALFGLSAAALSKTFMPSANYNTQLLNFFTILSLSVLARPIGAIVFGFIGDKNGRIEVIKIAAIIATAATSAICFIPTYSTIGWFAPIILIICRMLFVFSLAGEVDAVKIYINEKISSKYRHLAFGITLFYGQLGVLLAATIYHFTISSEIEYLWRLNFIYGGIGGVFIILMRNYLQESNEFLAIKTSNTHLVTKFGFVQIIKEHRLNFFLVSLAHGCIGGIYYFLIIFFHTFSTKIAEITKASDAELANIFFIIIYAIAAIISGFLADKFNPKKQIFISLLCSCLLVLTILYCAQWEYILYSTSLLVFLAPFYIIPIQITIQSVFSTGARMRMCSLAHSIGSVTISSTTPFFSMLIWAHTHSVSAVLCALLTQIVTLLITSTYLSR